MIGNKALSIFLAAMLLPVAATAGENINYTFLDMQYVDNGIDETYTETSAGESVTVDFDGGGGFALLGSLAVHDNWHVFAQYAATDVDLSGRFTADDVEESVSLGGDVDDWRLGVGFNLALTPNIDGVVQVGWENREVNLGSVTVLDETVSLDLDDDGFSVLAGLRGNITDDFELNGSVHYSEVLGLDVAADAEKDILDDDVLFAFGGVYHLTDMFSFGANVETGDSTAWQAFARFEFGS